MAGYIGSRASVVSSGAERKKTFDITGTTTVLTGLSYTPTFVHLFHNGVRLVDGTDYTATDSTSITLTTAAENGDQVVVVSYATFQAADAYTKAEADSAFVSDPNGAVTVDGSGNVGIGTAAPSAKMGINAAAPDFTFLQSDAVKYRMGVSNVTNGGITGSASGDYFARTSGGKMMFSTNDGVTAHATIDSSGNVGIGTTSPASMVGGTANTAILTVGGGDGSLISGDRTGTLSFITQDTTYTATFADGICGEVASVSDSPSGASYALTFSTGTIGGTNRGERMRIDSIGNVLVGTTDTNPVSSNTSSGVQLGDGRIRASRADRTVLEVNRKTSDGSIIDLYRDGAPVGRIGVQYSTDMVIGSGTSGVSFSSTGNAIVPSNPSAVNTYRDAAINLGYAGGRFKDLYLSGGVYLGGTVAANKLDDYEEGTWTAGCTVGSCAGANTTYTKVGDLVTVTGRVNTFSNIGVASQVVIVGIPFAASGDWIGSMIAKELNQITECSVYASGTSLTFYGVYSGNYDPLLHTDLKAGAEIYFSVTYKTTA